MSFWEKLKDQVLTSKKLLYLIVFTIVSIFIWESYLLFTAKLKLENLFFWLVFINLCLYYLIRMKYKINPQSFLETAERIKFANGRNGTDGICCFLSFKDFGVPLPRKKDQLLIRATLTKRPQPNETISDLILKNDFKLFGYGKRCINLQMDFEIRDDNLIFKFGCGNYEERPKACQDYPANNCGSCRLSEYISPPVEQVKHLGWSMIFLYAFDKKKFSYFEKFSVGTAENIFRSYYLVPVPFKNIRNIDNLLCQ